MVRQSAAAMEAGQVAEGPNALAVAAAAAGGGGGGAAAAAKEPAGLRCPRCDSSDTKFCYYNNYNLGQPRHFCRGCRRYWTRGGALRNVPVGGGTRKATPAARRKRASLTASATAPALYMASPGPLSMSAPAYATVRPYDLPAFMPSLASPLTTGDPGRRLLDLGGSFTPLLAPVPTPAPDVRFSAGFLMGGLPQVMPPPASSAPALLRPHPPVSQALPEGLIWSVGWPDLSI